MEFVFAVEMHNLNNPGVCTHVAEFDDWKDAAAYKKSATLQEWQKARGYVLKITKYPK